MRRHSHHTLDRLLQIEQEQLEILRKIEHDLNPRTITHFRINQENKMAIIGIIPGDTGTFTATPLNKEGATVTLPSGTVPVWTSSDTTNAPVVAAADGLSATITVPASYAPAPGTTFNLTVAMPDGTASTTVPVPFDAVAVDNTVASFGVNQT